jgi:hypothetical protein
MLKVQVEAVADGESRTRLKIVCSAPGAGAIR